MKIKKFLKEIKKNQKEINFYLEEFFERKIKEAKEKERKILIKNLKNFCLGGGKRLRPILFCLGFEFSGKKLTKKVLKASIFLELLHSYLLIHDDIIDQDFLRHNKPTLNFYYQKIGKKQYKIKSDLKTEHFGNSVAIILGDLCFDFCLETFLENSIKNSQEFYKIFSNFIKIVDDVIFGQSQDIILEKKSKVSFKEIISVYFYKTARYSFVGPLWLGVMFSGVKENFLEKIEKIAIPMGIAFQIQDDVLGVFGKKTKTGKSTFSDIYQGKKTLLFYFAYKSTKKNDKKFLEKWYGNPKITKEKAEKIKEIFKKTKAKEYSQNLAEDLFLKAKEIIEKSDFPKKIKEKLAFLCLYLSQRRY